MRLTINTNQGKKRIIAQAVSEHFAYHRPSSIHPSHHHSRYGGWSITHIPTGKMIGICDRKRYVKPIVQRLSNIPKVNWSEADEKRLCSDLFNHCMYIHYLFECAKWRMKVSEFMGFEEWHWRKYGKQF